MKEYYLGVDVGGTKTHCLIADQNGEAVGFGEAGPGNHEGVGYEGLYLALQTSCEQAFHQAGISWDLITGAGFGIAGYDWPSERQPTLDTIYRLKLKAEIDAVNDAVVGMLAGASRGWGIGVDAGTGDNVYGLSPDGQIAHMTGCGEFFGEYGGSGSVVLRAVQMVSYQWSGRGGSTALSDAFIKLTGAMDLDDLLEGLSQGKYNLWSEAAPLVFKVANEGDKVAQDAIGWVAGELAESTLAVIRKLKMENMSFEVVMIGSMFNGGAVFIDPFKERILRNSPKAEFIKLSVPPVVGGVLLGVKVAGENPLFIRERLIQSTNHLLEMKNELNRVVSQEEK
jgi:N-acetylglucosamine kinase-like BadF-type ATPase